MGKAAGLIIFANDKYGKSGKAAMKKSKVFKPILVAITAVISVSNFVWALTKKWADASTGMSFDTF